MKKKFLLVGVITTMGLGVFFSSCEKDDEEKTCMCQESTGASRQITPSSYNAGSCSDLELKLRDAYGYIYSCH